MSLIWRLVREDTLWEVFTEEAAVDVECSEPVAEELEMEELAVCCPGGCLTICQFGSWIIGLIGNGAGS